MIRIVSGIALAFVAATANAALIKSYDFTTGLNDALSNGVDLVASGGTVSAGRYSFGQNQGLRLDSAVPSTTDYALEVKFLVDDSVGSWNKIIDFSQLTSDLGLYIFNGTLNYYSGVGNGGVIGLDQDYVLGFELTGGSNIAVFLDGALVFNGTTTSAQPSSNVLNFFEDDTFTGQSEAFVGSVDYIRVHNDRSTFGQAPTVSDPTVPEPAPLALIAAGAMLLATKRFKLA